MPINDLPKSLVDSVIDVVTKSEETYNNTVQRIVSEGLTHFGVSCVTELSEADQKALHAWTQIRLTEADCSCGTDVEEDDMPGDAPFHKDGDEAGEKKKEIDEEDDAEVDLTEASLKSTSKNIIKSEVLDILKDIDANSEVVSLFNKAFGSASSITLKELGDKMRKLSTSSTDKKVGAVFGILSLELTESIAIGADEIATNGAVGVGDATLALPKHADVIHDTDPYTNTTQYRLLIQYATNEGTRIYPPVSLPGAASVADLRALVEGLPEFNEALDSALVNAS